MPNPPGTIPLFGSSYYLYDPRNPPGQIEERLANAELLRQKAQDLADARQQAADMLMQWRNLPDPTRAVTVPGEPAHDTTFNVPSAPTVTGSVASEDQRAGDASFQALAPPEDPGLGKASMAVPAGKPTQRPASAAEVAGRVRGAMSPAQADNWLASYVKAADDAAKLAAAKQPAIPKTIPEIIAAIAGGTLDPQKGRAQLADLIRAEADDAEAKKNAQFMPTAQFNEGQAIVQRKPGQFSVDPTLSVAKPAPQPTPTTMELDNAKYALSLEKGDQYTPSTEEVAAKAMSLKSRSEFKSLIPIIDAARRAEASGDTAKAKDLRGLVRESITALSQVAGANTAAQQASLANAPVAAHGNVASRMLMPDGSGVDSTRSLPQLEAAGALLFPSPNMMDAFHQGLLFERQMPEVLAAAKKFFGPEAVARREPPGFFRGMQESLGTYLKTTKVGQGLNPEAASFIGQVKSLGLKLARVDNGGRPTEPDYDKAAGVLFGDWDTYEAFRDRVVNGQRIAKDSMTNMRKQAVKPTAATPLALPGGGSYAPVTE